MALVFVNNYKPPPKQQNASTNLNFVLPVPDVIDTDRVKLVHFIPSIHAKLFHQRACQDPNLDQWLPIDISTLEDVYDLSQRYRVDKPNHVLFAIVDRTKEDGELAGMIGAIQCSPEHLSVEIGPVIILPDYQGTYVSKHAIGAMLKHWLDLPLQGGMGFRRVSWASHPQNGRSLGVAKKMGFKEEAVLKWTRVLPRGKLGKNSPPERGEGGGVDTVYLSVCWDDWENGVREKVQKLLEA